MVQVDTSSITKAEFQGQLSRSIANYARTRGAAGKVFFDPPQFTTCAVDEQRSSIGGKEASSAELRRRCKARYDAFKRSTLDAMIQDQWIKQAAARHGISVSDPEQIIRARSELERRALRAQRGATPADIAAFYRSHKRELIQPERRDIDSILTDSKADALAARRAILHGATWRKAARRFDVTSHLDSQVDQTRMSLSEPSRSAAFTSPRGGVSAPLETFNGWQLLTVRGIRPAFQMKFQQSVATIKDFLDTNRRRYAHYVYQARFIKQSRTKTRCIGALKVPSCRNGPTSVSNRPVSHEDALNRPMTPLMRKSYGGHGADDRTPSDASEDTGR